MPELYELWAALLVLLKWFYSVKDDPKVSKLLQSLWADPTGSEQKNSKKSSLAGQGHVYSLDRSSKIKRGPQGSQAPVWPPYISTPIQDAKLELRDIHYNPRNVIFEFKGVESGEEMWLQVQMLTHTVVQVYDRKQWDNSISQVDRKARGFKVGMALDFGEYVVAFLSLDLLFKPIWARSREELSAQHIDVCSDFIGFVKQAVTWAEKRLLTPRHGFATDAIRKACEVFGGVGVYTVQELFFRAGLSPFLTEAEVFDNPSRFSRFCEAYYTHAIKARDSLWDLLFPHLYSRYILAVENEDRLDYAAWLFVYAKDRTYISTRMKELLISYKNRIHELSQSEEDWVRDSSQELYDVFEPTYIKPSLIKETNLGHLIWGCNSWLSMGGTRWLDCPLDAYFLQRGINLTTESFPTFLRPISPHLAPEIFKTTLFVDDRKLKASWVETKLYQSYDKPIWTLLPSFPYNSRKPPNDAIKDGKLPNLEVTQVTGLAREKQLFEYIVKHTNDYAVGPLDYCGIARIIHGRVLICRNNPVSRSYDAKRLEENFARRSRLKPGIRKTVTKRKCTSKSGMLVESDATNLQPLGSDKIGGSSPPIKRQRLSADKKLLLGIS